MPEFSTPAAHAEFQYASASHQAETAISGMWLFLATEVLFFGGLFLVWLTYRHWHPAGFAYATRRMELGIGTANTALLLTSSFAFAWGLAGIKRGNHRVLLRAALLTAALGLAFLVLKGIEWNKDFNDHLFPGAGFGLAGPDPGGSRLFTIFYFIATGLHGVHMIGGIVLVLLVAHKAARGGYSRQHHVGAEVTGLYWSFVDIVWMVLYPLIYLAGR